MNRITEQIEGVLEWGGIKKQAVFLIVSAISLALSIFKVPLFFEPSYIAVILCGLPIIIEALIGLITRLDIRAGVLVSLALIAALCIGEEFAAGEVAFIMQLGELLEHLTVEKAKSGIEKLIDLTPKTARIVKDGKEETVTLEKVKVGDILRVMPGEAVPVDGIIIEGQSSINQAVMTGESMPVDKKEGDLVSSGTVNLFGSFLMRAEKIESESSLQQMIELVKSADNKKAKIVKTADRWATYVVIAALFVAVLAWLLTGDIVRAVTVLVVFCPCALVLATPTAIMAAMGNSAKHGFLIGSGEALEKLSKVNEITFDKTGTLTYGTPFVIKVKSLSDYEDGEIYKYAASAEKLSEHPLGKAIASSFERENGEFLKTEDFSIMPGKGVTARVLGKEIKAGNLEFLNAEEPLEVSEYLDKGQTVIYVGIDGILSGFIVLSDEIRSDSLYMIEEIKKMGITPVLLTGDNERVAENIASALGIEKVKASCLPEDKLEFIGNEQKEGNVVAMIGDGVNDAPALKASDVGIAMGGIGSDIALEASDITLVSDEVKKLPHLLGLSKKMMKTIKLNFIFSMGLNFLAILLAATGHLGPVMGALVHNAGSVAVIINSALLLKWKK